MKNPLFKTFVALLAVCMLLSMLCGCGSSTVITEPTQEAVATAEPAAVPTAEPETAAPTETAAPEATDAPDYTEAPSTVVSAVEVSFDFTRMSTHASNQIAIWIEDESGHIVKTVFVTDFTAGRRGYENREDALVHWVEAADPSGMSDTEVDAVSGPTPQAGHVTYVWDITDDAGNRVADGVYRIIIEGTLYWSSNVLYTAEIDLSNATEGTLEFSVTRSEPENTQNDSMLGNVVFYVKTN